MITGSCLCEGVQYVYEDEIQELTVCHCNMCKRAQGTAFATNAPIKRAFFRLVQGESLLKAYISSAMKKRVFCSNCGSPLYSERTDLPEIIRLRVGTVTSGHIPQPTCQIFCDSAADWLKLDSECPQYRERQE